MKKLMLLAIVAVALSGCAKPATSGERNTDGTPKKTETGVSAGAGIGTGSPHVGIGLGIGFGL